MEKTVIFRDRQELQAGDLASLQTFAQEAVDHVVGDALATAPFYHGMLVSQNSATDVNVADGRFYNTGKVYAHLQTETLSLFAYLPVVTKRIITVAVLGNEQDTDVQPRDFLVDLTNGTTEPQAVAMEHRRICTVNLVPGAEAADPQAPALAAGLTAIAFVTLGTTGIVSIEMMLSSKLPSLQDHEMRVDELELWMGQAEPRIASIATDLSALARKTEGLTTKMSFAEISADMARVKVKLNLPTAYASYSTDYFGDQTKTDLAGAGYAARVKNGLLFPYVASAQVNLALLNPIDSSVKVHAGTSLCLPGYDEIARLKIEGYSGDVSMSSYQVQVQTVRAYEHTLIDWHWGWNCNLYAPWYAGNWWNWYGYEWDWWVSRPYQYFSTRTETYYALATTTTDFTGALIAQTFLTPNAFWLTSLGLNFTQIAATGDVQVLVVECDGGKPNLQKAVTQTLLLKADMKQYPQETRIVLPPVLLDAGKRYAVALLTQGAHRIAVVGGDNYTQGTFFYSTDAEWFQGDLTKDLMFTLYGAQFRQPRLEVALQALSLAGGITDVAISAPQVTPKGAEVQFEIQVGGKWYPFGDPALPLSTAPNLVPFRAVFLGTSDLAVGVVLANNAVTVSRPDTAMLHWSTLRTLGSSSTQILVQAVLVGYDAAKHTVGGALLSGVTTYTPSTTVVKDEPDGISKRVTWTFNIGGGISSYQIKLTAGRNTTADAPFTIVERTDVAL